MPRTWSGACRGRPGSEINSEKTRTSVTPDTKSPGHAGALIQHFIRIRHVKTHLKYLGPKLVQTSK